MEGRKTDNLLAELTLVNEDVKLYKMAYTAAVEDRKDLSIKLSKYNRCSACKGLVPQTWSENDEHDSCVVSAQGLGLVPSWYVAKEVVLMQEEIDQVRMELHTARSENLKLRQQLETVYAYKNTVNSIKASTEDKLLECT